MGSFNVIVIGDDVERRIGQYGTKEKGDKAYVGVKGSLYYSYSPCVTTGWILKSGCEPVYQPLSWLWSPERYYPPDNWINQARKGDIDWDATANWGAEKRGEEWDRQIKLMKHDKLSGSLESWMKKFFQAESKEDYMNRDKDLHVLPMAVIKADDWHWPYKYVRRKGKMYTSYDRRITDLEWRDEFFKLLEDVPDDTVLHLIHCGE